MLLRVKVIPRSSRTGFDSVMGDGTYKIRLKSPPVDGKANSELIRWLSRQFGVLRRDVVVRSGASSRSKSLRISCPASTPEWFNG